MKVKVVDILQTDVVTARLRFDDQRPPSFPVRAVSGKIPEETHET